MIPYYDVDGKQTGFFRVRFLGEAKRSGFEALTNHKDLRYMQLASQLPRAYFPRTFDWKTFFAGTGTHEKKLIVTEGELKAASAAKMGFAAIGLGGVWNFKADGALIEDVAALPLKDLPVYICYDSEALTNFQVLRAENALAREFLARGADLYLVRLPELIPGKKTGLDDFLVAKGRDAFEKLIAEAERWKASELLHRLNDEVVYLEDPGVILKLENLQRITAHDFVTHAFSDWI